MIDFKIVKYLQNKYIIINYVINIIYLIFDNF